MVVAFVLVTGIVVILVVGAAVLAYMGMGNLLASMLPLAPCLVTIGTLLLILTELLLFLGNKDDKRAAKRDLVYLIPTCLVSGIVWWAAQKFVW